MKSDKAIDLLQTALILVVSIIAGCHLGNAMNVPEPVAVPHINGDR